MADKIQIKRSSEEGKKPTEQQLVDGELALNLKDRKIYAKDSDGVVQEFPSVDAVDVGVQKVNELTGEIEIKGSDNISVEKSGQNLTLDVKDTVALKTDVPAQVNLQEGNGIDITGNYPNLTITNEVTKIDDLSDVDTSGNVQGNSILVYDSEAGQWKPGTGGGSSDVENLPDLGDVTISPDPPTQGQVLQYTDGQWKNVDVDAAEGRTTVNTIGGAVTIKGTSPISVASPNPNDDNEIVIGYSGTQGIPEAPEDGNQYARKDKAWSQVQATGGGADTLSELTDTDISTRTNDQFLRWDGDEATGKWKNETVSLAPSDAEKNVQSDWNEATAASDAFILNKPTNLTDFENDLTLAPSDAEKNVQSNWTETGADSDAFILNKPTKLSDFQDDLGYTDTDTGIVKLTHGTESVTGGEGREVTFKSSDASVVFELNANNEIDFKVPLAGLNIQGVVQYAQPQTQANGKITVNGSEYEVLWDPATYLDEAQSGVAGAALGDLWIVQYQGDANDEGTEADGNGYVYSLDESGNPEWSLVGPIQGPPGADGSSFLPISSTDDKVTLSDDGGTFQIKTGDPTTNPSGKAVRVEVDSIGHVAINGKDSDETIPRTNTMLEVVSDATSPFVLILDGTESSGVYAGRFGIRQYGTSTNYEYCIDDTNGTYMFSGGSNARSTILYGDATADILVKPNGYVRLTPEVRTDTITTKDAAQKTADTDEDPKIILNSSVTSDGVTTKAIALHAGSYNNKPPLFVSQGDGVQPSTTNSLQNGQVLTLSNNDPSVSKDDPAFVGMAFRNIGSSPSSMGTFGLRQSYNGDDATAEGDFVFYVRDNAGDGGRPPKEVLSVSNDDIRANPDYEPQTDDSLVTKGWVTTNGASGNLPISSTDGYTTLDALNVSEFSVRAKTTKLYNQTSDDVNLTFHHNKSWVEGAGACYLYAGNTAGGRVGVGTGCTIAVGRTIDNPDYIPPNDSENPRPPEYDDTTPETIIETHESFRICPEHGNVALGDTLSGSATNGVFARWDGRSLATNFVTYCDVATVPDVPKAVNPDYIDDIDSRPDDYDPSTPEYILDPDATAEELKQYVSTMYGHWSQISSLNSVGEAGGAPLTTVNFFAVPGALDGLKKVSKGFLHQSENRVTEKSYGFESQQVLVTGVTAYAFYASASAPSRFNGGVQTDTITTQNAAADDVEIILNGAQVKIEGGYSPLRLKNLASNGACIASESAFGTYTFGTTGLGWSVITSNNDYRISIDDDETRFYKTDGATTQLLVNDTMIRADSGYVPSGDYDLVTKKWVTDNTGAGGFPIESLPDGRVLIEADDADGTITSWVDCILADTDPDKSVPDSGVYTWYVNDKPEFNPPYGSPGAPALRLTQQGVLETASGYLRDGLSDQTGLVNGQGLEGIRNTLFYPHVQNARLLAQDGTVAAEWDEVNYHFMRDRNPLDSKGAALCDWVAADHTSQGCAWEHSLFTIRQGGIDGSIHITTSADYEPLDDYDIVTKKYFDDNRVPLPNPDVPIPPVGSGAGYTWEELEQTPGAFLSAVYGINGIFSIIGFSSMGAEVDSTSATLEPQCYWSTDGRNWTEGFVGGSWKAGVVSSNLRLIPSLQNEYGRVCDGTQVLFTGHAFTSSGKTWQGFDTDFTGSSTDTRIGTGVPVYFDSGFLVDQWADEEGVVRTTWPEGPCWVTSKGYCIEDLNEDKSNDMIAGFAQCKLTNTDVQLTNLGHVISPKWYYSSSNGTEHVARFSQYLQKPLQSEAAIKASAKTDDIGIYFQSVNNTWNWKDASTQNDGKASLVLGEDDNQFYWLVHKRTTLTVPSGLWQETGLCCAYDRSRNLFAAVTSDTVRMYEAPYSTGTYAYGGRLVSTYTIPQSGEWTHVSISGGVIILMSKSGLIARLDTNNDNPNNNTFEILGASSPTVFSQNPVLGGTNGRFLIVSGEDVDGYPDFGANINPLPLNSLPTDPPQDQKYAWSGGDNDPGSQTTTGEIDLTDPVDTGGGKRSARKLLTTQKDANEYFAEEIAKRAVVVTLTQAEYDALDDVKQDVLYLITF